MHQKVQFRAVDINEIHFEKLIFRGAVIVFFLHDHTWFKFSFPDDQAESLLDIHFRNSPEFPEGDSGEIAIWSRHESILTRTFCAELAKLGIFSFLRSLIFKNTFQSFVSSLRWVRDLKEYLQTWHQINSAALAFVSAAS